MSMSGTIEPHQQRMLDEFSALRDKAAALLRFLEGDMYPSLGVDEQVRLKLQHYYMTGYLEILGQRIKAFRKP
jgi:hypothetical protein